MVLWTQESQSFSGASVATVADKAIKESHGHDKVKELVSLGFPEASAKV
jgi:hypothetical protein